MLGNLWSPIQLVKVSGFNIVIASHDWTVKAQNNFRMHSVQLHTVVLLFPTSVYVTWLVDWLVCNFLEGNIFDEG